MSKPFKITDEMREAFIKKVSDAIRSWKTEDDITRIQPTLKDMGVKNDLRTNLVFSQTAWEKMCALVDAFESEVAWHGTVSRIDGGFRIEDIVIYPQEVTGATVNTDQKKYETWLMELDDDMFNALRFQGHSHVNMGTSPSGIDTTHQKKIIEQIEGDDFYIFMICNKRREQYIKIVDGATNTVYETTDVNVSVDSPIYDRAAFLKNARENVSRRAFVYPDRNDKKADKKESKEKSVKVTQPSQKYPNTGKSYREEVDTKNYLGYYSDDETDYWGRWAWFHDRHC